MISMATTARERNAAMFAPDFEFERRVDLLVGLPPVRTLAMRRDGTWQLTFLDGSTLDHTGVARVWVHEPFELDLAA